jgi:ATP-dependent RNA helicase RhlE
MTLASPSFSDLGLISQLQRAVLAEKYAEPTPIQVQAIPPLLRGSDLLGCAQTGSGKTAAFALPILQRLEASGLTASNLPRALVLAPTRELAVQITESFRTYGQFLRLSCTAVFGGVGQDRQVRDLRRGVDILVATPGRLLDLMDQGFVRLSKTEILVLDEADRMLDMGFIHDVRRVIRALPSKRQTMLFSATMPAAVAGLAQSVLHSPVNIAVTPVSSTAPKIDECVVFVDRGRKTAVLEGFLARPEVSRALIFTRTKRGADRLVRQLSGAQIRAQALHGNKSQNERQHTLEGFREGRVRFLVATDLAARGIDVESISHIVNYDIPVEPEVYVHRIGRTARAGASGKAISFCSAEEYADLRNIERLIKRRVPVVDDSLNPQPDPHAPPAATNGHTATAAPAPSRALPGIRRIAPRQIAAPARVVTRSFRTRRR